MAAFNSSVKDEIVTSPASNRITYYNSSQKYLFSEKDDEDAEDILNIELDTDTEQYINAQVEEEASDFGIISDENCDLPVLSSIHSTKINADISPENDDLWTVKEDALSTVNEERSDHPVALNQQLLKDSIERFLQEEWMKFVHSKSSINMNGEPRDLKTARKRQNHRRDQLQHEKYYKKANLGTRFKTSPSSGDDAGIVLEKVGVGAKKPNVSVKNSARQLIKNRKKSSAFIPRDGCLNYIEEKDAVLVAGFGQKGYAVGDIPGSDMVTTECKSKEFIVQTLKAKKPFVCDVCNSDYGSKRSLVRHKLEHQGKKSFTCKVCSVKFRYKWNLTVHKRLHIDQKLFVCEICYRGFNQSDELKKHNETHNSKGKICECNVCGSFFTSIKGLKIHLLVHLNSSPLL